MKYLLDTNILLVYLRKQKTKDYIDENYQPFSAPNIPLLSVVSKGEIKSVGLRNKWGLARLQSLDLFLVGLEHRLGAHASARVLARRPACRYQEVSQTYRFIKLFSLKK